MADLSASTHVAAPIDQVFEVYTAIDRAADRIPSIVKVEMLTSGPFGEGTRWRETRLMFGKEATEEMWVTGFDPPRSYTVAAESHGMRYATLFAFQPDGDGTKVTWTFSGTPQTFLTRLFSPIFNVMMKGTMKKCMGEDLEALRAVCEQGAE